ncbi:MSMEG_6728 family protein [Agromyces aurantiacus]|uniref:MSMEG_6728 family protein n=1 Tax=Agromyces aurantiacus TaxID=165814 RepID=A0ABV9R4R4_9MICO|nr:MSMEG_6728 family protein [Agromyces aurantiacus]MBM7503125.1 hypothetical protein [Agromyces aurantiacus]
MQTFLPFAEFDRSAAALDTVRLGKQRVETLQVMRALTIPDYGWRHHPVVRMWRGFRPALMAYQDAVCDEWERRGHVDTCRAKTLVDLDVDHHDGAAYRDRDFTLPPWVGDDAFHRSHRSNLLRKDPEFYSDFAAEVPADLPYVWPPGHETIV